MAATKTSRSEAAKKAAAKRRPTTANRSTTKKRKSTAKNSPSRSSSGNRSRDGGASASGIANGVSAIRETVGDAGEKAGHATTKAASKAKIPLIAGGAALVGAASGIAVTAARSRGGKVLGMQMPKAKVKIRTKDLAKTADRVASAGEQIGRLSTGLRELQGTAGTNGNGQKRSPIEVLLQGLTRRN